MKSDNFTGTKLTLDNMDNFFIRQSIFNAIKKKSPDFKGRLLDIGCGKMPYKKYIMENSKVNEYVGLDIDDALTYDPDIKPDAVWSGEEIPFEDSYFDTIFLTEVLEHCPDPSLLLKEALRVLKPQGIIFFTVPFLWPLHETPRDEYRFTPFSLERILRNSGFREIEISAGGGWHASLAQMLGLWIKRAPLRNWQKYLFSPIIKPIISILIKKDKKLDNSVKEQQMFTNFYGTAKK